MYLPRELFPYKSAILFILTAALISFLILNVVCSPNLFLALNWLGGKNKDVRNKAMT